MRTIFLGAMFMASTTAVAAVLPAPGSVLTVQYGDFTVYSLGYLDAVTPGGFKVQSTPGSIQNDIVVATGSNGVGVTTNFAGMDDAFATPNGSGQKVWETSDGPDPSGGPAFGDTGTTWDASLSSIRSYLGGSDLLIYFNLNETNSGNSLLNSNQDAVGWAKITIKDAEGLLPDITYVFEGSSPATSFLYDFTNETAGGPGAINSGYIHGAICVDGGGALIGFGACTGPGTTINQNLGANEAAFALWNQSLSNLINDAASGYDTLQADIKLGEINNGFEQIFLQKGTVNQPVPEPASLALLGLGAIGLGWARRRRTAK
jgi:hypothetical protein